MLNHGHFKKEDFEVNGENGGTYLSESGRAVFFRHFCAALARTFKTAEGTRDIRGAIETDVLNYLDALHGKPAAQFFHLRQ